LKKERSRKYRLLQILRIIVQAAFFGLFLYLLFGTHFSGEDYIGRVEAIFHFDPLLGLATFIASRTFFKVFLLALVTVGVTILFGRFACGWVCPLGSVHQFFSFVFKRTKWHKPRLEGSRRLAWKYAVLLFILIGSVFTLDLVGFFDPLSLLYRSFATAVMPALSIVAGATTASLYKIGLSSLGDSLTQFIQSLTVNSTFHQGLFIGLIFVGVVMLNMVRERFWCRYHRVCGRTWRGAGLGQEDTQKARGPSRDGPRGRSSVGEPCYNFSDTRSGLRISAGHRMGALWRRALYPPGKADNEASST